MKDRIQSKRVCICGGGNIAHAVASVLGEQDEVSVVTRRPESWNSVLEYQMGDDHSVRRVNIHPTNDMSVVKDAEFVFVALPRFAIKETLHKIDSFLHVGQTVMFVPAPAGLEPVVDQYKARGINTVGFQRVPHVARIIEYGHRVWIGDVRRVSRIAVSAESSNDSVVAYVKDRLGSEVNLLSSFLSFTFSNSNPLLHPSRLVSLLRGGDNGVYEKCPYFYGQWTDESSELYIKADAEMYAAFRHYSEVSASLDYESALDHYESKNLKEMTAKITSIESLKSILAPWKKCENGLWCPDLDSRYFTEDIPYGTKIIQQYAHREGLSVPTIDYLINFIARYMQLNGR